MTDDATTLRERAERAEADAKAWQENYDGMFWRWAECDAERLRLKDELESALLRLRVIAVDPTPFHCYPCARGDHAEHKTNAWEPDVRCECACTIPPWSPNA